ncbi:MAG: zinc ribbon domain-containing protein [Myxococcales bacterium]|nr:zinc ribbon domain-containing protein [Myxococcales bacterium]
MPTYEYECLACKKRFEKEQAMSEPAHSTCPACGGKVRRIITGTGGFILKGSGAVAGQRKAESGCSFEQTGRTCCGRDSRCGKSCDGEE